VVGRIRPGLAVPGSTLIGSQSAVKPAAAQPAFTGVPKKHFGCSLLAGVARHVQRGTACVRIETPERGFGWTAEARTVHHTSHAAALMTMFS